MRVDNKNFDQNEFLLETLSRARTPGMDVGDLISAADTLNSQSMHDSAINLYLIWILFHPDHPLLYAVKYNLSIRLFKMNNLGSAIKTLQEVIDLNPEFFPAYINRGNYLEVAGYPDLAIAVWQQLLLKLSPISAETVDFKLSALKQIARVTRTQQKLEESETAIQRSLKISVDQPDMVEQWVGIRLAQCCWPLFRGVDPATRRKYMTMLAPLSAATYTDDPIFHLVNAYRYNRSKMGWPAEFFDENNWPEPIKNKKRLKIGYVSSDLREHAVGFSMMELFELHERSKVEVYGYYIGSVKSKDSIQERIKNGLDHWVDLSELDDEAACKMILNDRIDILVDVNGYTKDARTTVFSKRPAPIIVNWFGYPGTMGSPYHHYIIADDVIIPKELEKYYSEKVVRLTCYQPNDRKRNISNRIQTRAEAGLPDDAVIFCSLNGLQKLNQPTFDVWMRILKRVPTGVLWLLSGSDAAKRQIVSEAQNQGISSDRIIFADPKRNPEHVARYQLADLFLDNMPYGAHTTAADSLWMGTPILTLTGTSFAARVCSSLVRAAGLEETICTSISDYEEKAVALGNDRDQLARLRKLLIENKGKTPLFNTPQLVDELEEAYRVMWNDYCTGNLPTPDLRNLDGFLEVISEIDHENLSLLDFSRVEKKYNEILEGKNRYYPLHLNQKFLN